MDPEIRCNIAAVVKPRLYICTEAVLRPNLGAALRGAEPRGTHELARDLRECLEGQRGSDIWDACGPCCWLVRVRQ